MVRVFVDAPLLFFGIGGNFQRVEVLRHLRIHGKKALAVKFHAARWSAETHAQERIPVCGGSGDPYALFLLQALHGQRGIDALDHGVVRIDTDCAPFLGGFIEVLAQAQALG